MAAKFAYAYRNGSCGAYYAAECTSALIRQRVDTATIAVSIFAVVAAAVNIAALTILA